MENELTVDVSEWNSTTPVVLTLYNALGNRLYNATGNGITTITVGSYPSGVYILKIQNGKHIITRKLKK